MNEGNRAIFIPVVTGRVDSTTIGQVFKGWSSSPNLQEKFNPLIELTKARQLRDEVIHKFMVRPAHLAGTPADMRKYQAQLTLIKGLIDRQWTKGMIESYLATSIPMAEWKSLTEVEK